MPHFANPLTRTRLTSARLESCCVGRQHVSVVSQCRPNASVQMQRQFNPVSELALWPNLFAFADWLKTVIGLTIKMRLMQGALQKMVLTVLVCAGFDARADSYILPPEDVDLIGEIEFAETREKETLADVARRFDVGHEEIVIANPGVDRWMPGDNTRVVLPKRYILPRAPRNGIVLNISEMRLFYYAPAKSKQDLNVVTHPVSIGRMDWVTPLGLARVVAKVKDPSWTPPKSVKEEHEADGDLLPDIVPPGPDNPLGRFALKLDIPGYLIHSTNKPYGIGMRVTHGCVRMYPEDIENMFPAVRTGTAVHIVNQAIKLGWMADTLYIEVHPPLEEEQQAYQEILDKAMDLIMDNETTKGLVLNGHALKQALYEQHGVPVAISMKPGVNTES